MKVKQIIGRLRRHLWHRWRESWTSLRTWHLAGPRHPRKHIDGVIAVCLVRNGRGWLEALLEHHRHIGIEHFVFIDNGSTDESIAYLQEQDDVTLLACKLPPKHYENHMRRYAIQNVVESGWYLCIDADELFDYPHSSDVDINELCNYLDQNDYNCVVAQMLDMLPKDDSQSAKHYKKSELMAAFPFYELEHINRQTYYDRNIKFTYFMQQNTIASPQICFFSGGVRARAFDAQPCLTKHPLVKLGDGVDPALHPHVSTGLHCADFTALLLHYKFAMDFHSRTKREIKENRWNHGEDHAYLKGLETKGSPTADPALAKRFTDCKQLAKQGFLIHSPTLEQWLHNKSRRSA